MKYLASIIVALLLAVPCVGQYQARTDFVPQRAIRVTKASGQVRAFPATAAGLDSAVDALAAGDTLETRGTYTLTDDLEFDVRATWNAYGTTITRAGDLVTVSVDNVTIRDLRTDGRVLVTGGDNFTATDCYFDGNAQASAVSLEALAHFASFSQCTLRRGTTAACYCTQVNAPKWTNCNIVDSAGTGLYWNYDAGAALGYRGVGASGGVSETKFNGPHVSGCTIANNATFGIFSNRTHDPQIVGNSIERNGLAGIYLTSPVQPVIVGNVLEYNNSSGSASFLTTAEIYLQLDSDNGEFATSCLQIQNNQFSGYYQGIIAAGVAGITYDINITGNVFGGAVGDATTPSRAVWFKTWESVFQANVSGNSISGPSGGTLANFRGIDAGETSGANVGANRLVIEGNKIYDVGTGVRVSRLSGVKIGSNAIRGCTTGIFNTESDNTYLQSNVITNSVTADFTSSGTGHSYIAPEGNVGITPNVAATDSSKLATITPTAAFLTIVDDADVAAIRSTLGAGKFFRDCGHTTGSPTDATTYFFGTTQNALGSAAATRRVYIPSACRITKAYVTMVQTAGSAETSTISIRVNDSTDTTISSAITNDATTTTANNTALSVTLAAGDYITMKWVTPTWTSNPTTHTSVVVLEFEAL